MGKKHKNAATKRRRNSTAVPALGRPVIVEIVHEGAKDDGQRGQLAAHEKRVQQLLRECAGDMNFVRALGYLRAAMREHGVLDEDLWIMLQDFRRDPRLKQRLQNLAERCKQHVNLRIPDPDRSSGTHDKLTSGSSQPRGGTTGNRGRKSKGVWLVRTGQGPKPVKRTSSS